MDKFFVIDFDSTFVTVESLDELAAISLQNNPQKDEIIKKIKALTTKGMEGKIDFEKSLAKRIELFNPTVDDIQNLVEKLKDSITPSIKRNQSFFELYKDQIYIISGGFKEYILPIVKPFGIAESHILANTFVYSNKGSLDFARDDSKEKINNITGYDRNNPLAKSGGKSRAIKKLQLNGKIYVLGDGYTDYEVKENGTADVFIAFTENVRRKIVTDKADYVAKNFDEFLYWLNLPRSFSYPKTKIKVLLLENIHEVALERFRQEGYEIEAVPKALSEKELIKKVADVTILGIRSKTQITAEVIKAGRKLLAIGAFCIGTNQIDESSAAKQGVPVFNAPYSNTRSVVELVIGEIIMLARKTFEKSSQLHEGIWDKGAKGCFEVRGKKLGIIGYGNIGSQLSIVAEGLGMDIYYYDIGDKLTIGNAVSCNSMEEVLRIADVVTIHVDGRKENTNLIGKKEFEKMKDGVLFINASRGFIVDIQALAENIKSGKVAGAAIDVFPEEPEKNGPGFTTPLQKLPNVILTPHVGAGTQEAQENIGQFMSHKLIQFVNTGSTMLSTNFPQIQLDEVRDVHRLIHIHQNTPGVLAGINNILAQHGINIEGQYLKTNENVGYVITDVNSAYNKEVIKKLKQMPETIKVRVLY